MQNITASSEAQASKLHEQFEGIGVCPYDPTHNSTAIYAGNGDI